MVDVQYQQQIKRLQSQSSMRQFQNRNQMLQQQRQLQQLQNLQERARQEAQRPDAQEIQQRNNVDINDILSRLVRNKPVDPSFFSLPKKEQERLMNIANELQGSYERNLSRQAVAEAKAQILRSDPSAKFGTDFERSVAKEFLDNYDITAQRGRPLQLTVTQNAQTLVDNAQFKYYPQQTQKEIREVPLFNNTPFVYREKFQQFKQKLFPQAQPTRQAIERFGQEKAQRLAQDISNIGVTAGLSISGVPRVPTTAKIPIRQVPEPLFFEVQQPVVIGGKQQTVSAYQIVQETRPPSMMLKSSKDYGLLGSSDNIIVAPSKVKITTSLPSIVGKPVVTVTTTNGKKFILNTLTGVSREVTPEELKQLTKTQQYLFRQLGKERPVVPESTKFNVAEITKQDTGFQVFTGKSKTRFETASRTNLFFETPEFSQYKTEIQFKDITFPNSRATGKTSKLKGEIRVMKDVLILDDVKDVNFIKPNPNVKKTPLSVTFGKQEVIETLKPIPSKVPKVKTQIISKGETSKSYGNIGLLSGSVSRSNLRPSDDFITDFARGFQDFAPTKSTKAQETPRPRTEVIDLAIPKTSTSQVLVNVPKQQTSQFNLQVPKSNVIQSPINTQSPKQVSGLINLLRSAQTQQQKNMLRNILKARFGNPTRTLSKTPPRPPKIPSFEGNSKSGKSTTTDSLGFAVEVKKRGKFLPLGKPLSSLGEAVTKGIRFVDYDIARTFRIKDYLGNVVSLKNIPVGFRQSKTVSGGIVELSKGSINMFGEKSALRKSRRSKNVFGI